MTHITCPSCDLRFSRRSAATLRGCPFCGGDLREVSARLSVGCQLVEPVVSLADAPWPPPAPPHQGPRHL